MIVADLITIIDGELKKGDEEKEIFHVSTNPKTIDREVSIFISSSKDKIKEAIANGANVILSDIKNIDENITYIKTDSLKKALNRLLKRVISSEDASFYLLSENELNILKMILKSKRDIEFLDGDIEDLFEITINSKKHIFISDKKNLKDLIDDTKILSHEESGYIIEDDLLHTTFRVDGYVYQKARFSPIFFDDLLKVIALCKEISQEYQLEKLNYLDSFKPIKIDEKELIFSNSLENIYKALEYIKSDKRYIKSIVLTPKKTKLDYNITPIWYEDEDDIQTLLKDRYFDYAFVFTR